MKPRIDRTKFGSITIEGETFKRDVIIRLDGQVKKRKKKLSKAVYGTSHVISLDEARHIYQKGAQRLIIGAGQYGLVELSDEAAGYFRQKQCQTELLPTREAVQALSWMTVQGLEQGPGCRDQPVPRPVLSRTGQCHVLSTWET